ncbi:hypothetical protein [Streptomyces sp. NPDC003393]
MSTPEAQEKKNMAGRRTVLGGIGAATVAAVTASGSADAAPAMPAAAASHVTAAKETDPVTYRDKQILVDGKRLRRK